MNRIKKFLIENWIYVTALLLPWVITLLYCVVNGIWITGNGQIACSDMLASTIPYAYSIWDKVHMGDSLSYTWSVIDGSDFNLMMDWVISPITLIMLLLPRKMIPDFMQFTMIAKWSLCAFSMVYFFYNTKFNRLKEGKKQISLFLGMAFALGNGIISYLEYIVYTHVIIIFPFLLLLVEKMFNDREDYNVKWYKNISLWYYLLLTYCIFTYFYITFQICIFLMLWFFIQFDKWDKNSIKKILQFVIPSLMAGVSNIGLLIFQYNLFSSRSNTNNIEAYNAFVSGMLIKPHEFVNQLFVLKPIAKSMDIHPNIYLSVTAVFLVTLFSVIKLNIKKKIYLLSVLVFLILSFFIGKLNLLWHLMQIPNGFYNRFMYLFVFYMLFLALLVLNNISGIKKNDVVISYIILLGGMCISILNPKDIDSPLGFVLTILILSFLSIILIYYLKKSISKKQLMYIIAACGMAELCITSFCSFGYHKCSVSMYGENGIVDRLASAASKIQMEDCERLTCMYPLSNIGMVANRSADSGFVSGLNIENRDLHARLGMAYGGDVEFGTRGGSPLINILYNIRCGIGESKVLFSDEELIANVDDENVYRINRLVGLGYMVNPDVLNWDSTIDDCFEYQNDFVKKAIGKKGELFQKVLLNTECSDIYGEMINPDEEHLKDGVYYYNSELKYGGENDVKQIKTTITEDMDLYMFYKCPILFKAHIFIDGEQIHGDKTAFEQSTYHIGNVKKGQEVIIVLVPDRSYAIGNYYDFSLEFSKFDNDFFDELYDEICRNTYEIEVNQSDYIKGKVHADEDGIMMTSIPYNDAFTVYVDGTESNEKPVGGALIGVPVKQGDHIVEFRYSTPYLWLKWGILIGTVFLYIVVNAIVYSRKKNDDKMEGNR